VYAVAEAAMRGDGVQFWVDGAQFAAQGFDVGYAVVDAPLPLRDFSVSLHWSKRFEAESAHQWMRGLIMTTFRG
jgi:hypothetical protein